MTLLTLRQEAKFKSSNIAGSIEELSPAYCWESIEMSSDRKERNARGSFKAPFLLHISAIKLPLDLLDLFLVKSVTYSVSATFST